VRQHFGDIPRFVDAHRAYRPEQTAIFRQLYEFGLIMFEQPFPERTIAETAELQKRVRTPCLEKVSNPWQSPNRRSRSVLFASSTSRFGVLEG
jgi:hypothetical protein